MTDRSGAAQAHNWEWIEAAACRCGLEQHRAPVVRLICTGKAALYALELECRSIHRLDEWLAQATMVRGHKGWQC